MLSSLFLIFEMHTLFYATFPLCFKLIIPGRPREATKWETVDQVWVADKFYLAFANELLTFSYWQFQIKSYLFISLGILEDADRS